MIIKIKIHEKQFTKLRTLIINQKLAFKILESTNITKVNGNNLEVTLESFTSDPQDVFELGQKFKAIPDPIIMG